MGDKSLGLDEVLRAAQDSAPVESVDVIARKLEERFSASEVSFWLVDMLGQAAVRLPRAGAAGQTIGRTERRELAGSLYDRVLRSQEPHQEPAGEGGPGWPPR
ncbi:hypothetical protein GCM10010360_24780 [Streptomyces nogalater]